MKIVILTNPKYTGFVFGNLAGDFEFILRDEKYDFSEPFCEDYDIGISFMYQHRVPKEQLAKPWFNFHPAPLPKYKGRNLCYHAIMNGEKEFGASLHYMDENFDTGDIIEVLDFSIPEWATAEDLSGFAISASRQLFQLYFPRIIAGEEFPRTPNVGGKYYKKEEIEDFVMKKDRDVLGYGELTKKRIRAITYGDFYPKVEIGGVTYKIVKE